MLFFQESGRLGNQLFQYVALRTLFPREKIVLLGFSDLQTTFDGIDAIIINQNSNKLVRGLNYRVYRYFKSKRQFKLVYYLREITENQKREIIQDNGLFDFIKIAENGFFQSESFFDPLVINSLKFKEDILLKMRSHINNLVDNYFPVFVHVRRGDYTIWPSKQFPAILPLSYYQKCINIFRENHPNCFFIFISDDIYYVKDFFGDLKNSYISQGSPSEDLALMSICRGGILSASSFSWWGAYFSSKNHNNAIFLAPKYWAGHRKDSWFPESIKSNFISYIDLNNEKV